MKKNCIRMILEENSTVSAESFKRKSLQSKGTSNLCKRLSNLPNRTANLSIRTHNSSKNDRSPPPNSKQKTPAPGDSSPVAGVQSYLANNAKLFSDFLVNRKCVVEHFFRVGSRWHVAHAASSFRDGWEDDGFCVDAFFC